jgi:hypothetical protein
MAATRKDPVRRVEWYLGPDKEISPDELDAYEATGQFLFQPKLDGMWCCLTVGRPSEGRPNVLKSRDARTPVVSGSNAGDLPEQNISMPEGSVLVGELEAASEWATQQCERLGYRRLHLFDLPYGGSGHDFRDMTTDRRYEFLAGFHAVHFAGIDKLVERFPLVPSYTDKFRERYEEIIASGGEGCVLKKMSALYRTTRLDGKTDAFVRCKKHVTGDYVFLGIGMTPGGKTSAPSPTGRWGQYDAGGKLVFCMQAACPKEYLSEVNIGKLVCEYRGWELFKSGALRHAQWSRVRTDKSPEQCRLRG